MNPNKSFFKVLLLALILTPSSAIAANSNLPTLPENIAISPHSTNQPLAPNPNLIGERQWWETAIKILQILIEPQAEQPNPNSPTIKSPEPAQPDPIPNNSPNPQQNNNDSSNPALDPNR